MIFRINVKDGRYYYSLSATQFDTENLQIDITRDEFIDLIRQVIIHEPELIASADGD